MTGQIVVNGVENFTPIMDKLGNIASEIMPYMIHIAIRTLIIVLAIVAVKEILVYLSFKSMSTYRQRENRYRKYKSTFDGGERRNGVFHARFKKQYIRKRRKRYQF